MGSRASPPPPPLEISVRVEIHVTVSSFFSFRWMEKFVCSREHTKFVYFCIFVQFDELRSSNSNPFDSRQLTSNISGISGQAGIRITRLIRGIYYSHERGIVVYQFCLCDLYFLPIFLFLSLSLSSFQSSGWIN